MSGAEPTTERPAAQAYLLGALDFDAALALQRRLAYEVGDDGAPAAVVLCEHPVGVTIGREGSRAHVGLTEERLAARRCAVRWVARGGGVVLHAPGQVACYPVLPLDRLGLTAAEYVARLTGVVAELAAGFGAVPEVTGTAVRLRGRRVATVGVAVRGRVTTFGFVVNVCPDLALFRDISCDGDPLPMTSLQRECPARVRPQAVRQRLLELLAARFGFARVSVLHHHPAFLPRTPRHASVARPR